VALKVLRPELAAVIGAERFLAEIKTTAALQHPHILALFDSGHADGFLFYVMPLIEGESLRDRLVREHQLPVDDAVRLAKEIASALDYAHRHGVIHRDIKPENILLHDGSALVADFGIALAVSHAGGNRMTETGLSLGTPGYMSPEQATGERTIDARSDVYSLGCLLYEMLAGTPPHTGATMQAVIAAVVTKEPTRLAEHRKTVPLNVEAAVHKALAKLPADRFATADQFAKALSEPATGAQLAAISGFASAERRAPSAERRTWLVTGAAIALFALLAAWGWLGRPPEPGVNRYGLFLRPEESLQPGAAAISGGRIALSPNGEKLVYISMRNGVAHLALKRREDAHAKEIDGTTGASNPFFSPDGRQLGFLLNGRTIKLLPLEGGNALTLTDSLNATAADWGEDGFIYSESDSGIVRIRPGGGALEQIYKLGKKEIGTEWPVVLPKGKALLFRRRSTGQAASDFEIVAMKLPHGEAHVVTRGLYARYAPTGHLLVVTSDGKLVAFPFDAGKLEVTGPPAALYEGLESSPFRAEFALSNTGTLVYANATTSELRDVVWVNRQGAVTPVDTAWRVDGVVGTTALSPDGRQIAVGVRTGIQGQIWVKALPNGPFSRLTFGDSSFLRPNWSADGKEVIYLADRGDGTGIPTAKRADGVGTARALYTGKRTFGQVNESADGKWLIVRTPNSESGQGDILAVKPGDTTLVPLVVSPAREGHEALSADGKWLAYASAESGVLEVYVRPFPNAASARWQISAAGGSEPVWSHSGRALYYRNGKNDLIVAEIRTTPTFQVGAQRVMFSLLPFAPPGAVPSFEVTADDSKFLFMRQATNSQANEMIVTENWFPELAMKVKK
jgi:serine/threonine-protein kinase